MTYPFRLYIIAEEMSADYKAKLQVALDRIRQDFEVVQDWGLETRVAYRDKIEGEWTPNPYVDTIFDLQRISQEAKALKNFEGEEFHSFCFLFRVENWKATYGGLNVGGFFEGMSVQLARWYDRDDWIYEVLVEEVAHCIDEQVLRETGTKVEDYLRLSGDVDSLIIHGKDPRYIRKQYRPYFLQIAPLIIQTFKKRNERWEKEKKIKGFQLDIIAVLEKLVMLYRELVNKKKNPGY